MSNIICSDIFHEDERLLMLIRLFRKACTEWDKPILECADIFDRYGVDEYITDCYDLFHVQGDEANLEEIKEFIAGQREII